MANQECQELSTEVFSVDRISYLPDSVRFLILSFLPTMYSVQTTLLSKRWRGLWTGVPTLYFDYDGCRTTSVSCRCHRHSRDKPAGNFERFVNRALLLHNARSLNEFRLYWRDCCPFYFETWVSTAISRNIRHLEISLYQRSPMQLPSCVFTCETLETLGLWYAVLIDPPSLVHLPRLETLILVSVHMNEESFCKLLYGCPVIKSLSVRRSRNDSIASFRISSSSLRYLALNLCYFTSQDICYSLEINAPSLEYLNIRDKVSKNFVLENLTSLLEADIDVRLDDSGDDGMDDDEDDGDGNPPVGDYCNSVVKLLQGLCRARYLTLDNQTVKYFCNATAQLSTEFQTLSKLVVEVECCGWNSLQDLLESSVNLKELILRKGRLHEDIHHLSWRNPARVPRCLLSSLQEISITNFDDTEYDLAMVKYLLEHGEVLRKIKLYAAAALDVTAKSEMLKKISVLCRKSPRCEVHLLDVNSRPSHKHISRTPDWNCRCYKWP